MLGRGDRLCRWRGLRVLGFEAELFGQMVSGDSEDEGMQGVDGAEFAARGASRAASRVSSVSF